MAGGRPSKPTQIKRLEGNPGHRPLNSSEPQFTEDSGYAPKTLSEGARREWRRVVPELRAQGLLTVVDRAALEVYCESYALWRKCMDVIASEGTTCETPSGYIQQRPEVSIANNAAKQMKALMTEFGMTPSSRQRVTAQQPEYEQSTFDAWHSGDIVNEYSFDEDVVNA